MGGGVPDGVEQRVRGVLDGLAGRTSTCSWCGCGAGGTTWSRAGRPYGDRGDLDELLERVAVLLAERYRERSEELKLLDPERGIRPTGSRTRRWSATSATRTGSRAPWKGSASTSTTSASRVSGYPHLMPLLAPREGVTPDGGYAVRDYRAVDPGWGPWTTWSGCAGWPGAGG